MIVIRSQSPFPELPPERMNQHDETVGDELEREFIRLMCEPVEDAREDT